MANKKWAAVVLGFLALGIIFFYLLRGEEIKNTPVKNNVVVAFGDSLVEGVGAGPGKDFVSLVEKDLGINIINMGKAGDTTESALLRLEEVLETNPGLVILLLGGNDFLRRAEREETFKNLEIIIAKLQESGAVVMLLGVRGGLLSDGYDEYYEDLAKEYQTLYVSNVLKGLLGKDEYMYDSIHPNDAGYAIIAERVTEELQKVLK